MILITVKEWHQYLSNGYSLLLRILQFFDWLAGFQLELLQVILFNTVYLSGLVFLAPCFKYCSRGFPRTFSRILLLEECLRQTRYA